ncbi:putative chromate transport protein [Roseovarius albus]|uniref:Putative chromate transport protein n=1 Tax=Roseovarius albus TaxID=1247867 RepID=A0A1X6ZBX6_9RHOB|nr:chromate efflux transporter [Roseovarius albus]SLN46513.1 putative chromate transport protein [Roseovarius albus]
MTNPSLKDSLPVWWRIGLLSFGGPAAQIALMHRLIVDEKRWLSEQQYLNALSFCMLLPGPEAMQLATYTGWRLHGVRGGLIAGLLFVLPGAAVILALAMLYALYGSTPALETIFLGIKAAVLVIVFEALLRVARKGLTTTAHRAIAALSFVALFFFSLPFPMVILLAGLYGYFTTLTDPEPSDVTAPVRWQSTTKTIAIWLAVWILPLLILPTITNYDVLGQIGAFFSKLATVTFGGAYAVLAYMAQEAVETHSWLSAAEMVDGLGLAETTPGPLILVTEFVGFLAGARVNGELNLWLGTLAALTTLWATFAPCFLWVFAGAPYIEWLTSKPKLRAALAAISAAVVGVILNLSIWFALHVLFTRVDTLNWGPISAISPDPSSLNIAAIALMALAALLLLRLKQSVLVTLALCAGGAALMLAL